MKPSRIQQDINRGAAITLTGNVFRLTEFGLTLLAARLFGVHVWGQYVFMGALILPVTRLACAGMDRGIAWYVAKHHAARLEKEFFARVRNTMLALGAPLLLAMACYLALAGDAGKHLHVDNAAFILMGLSVPFLLLTNLNLGVSLAFKRVEHEVLVRGILHPALYLGLPCALAALTRSAWLLGAGFLAGSAAGWLASRILAGPFRRTLAANPPAEPGAEPFRALWAYSWPMGLRDMVLSLQSRVDVWTLAVFLPPQALGVYGLALSIANSVKTVRLAFDGILFAVIAQMRRGADNLEIRRAFVHAGGLIVSLQMPVFAFLVFFAAPLLGLSGPAYAEGETVLLIFALVITVTSYTGLSGMVVMGMGKSRWALANDIVALAIAAALNLLLVPRFGLAGAAWGTSLSILLSSAIWYLEAIYLIRRVPFSLSVGLNFVVGLGLCAAAYLLWRMHGAAELPSRAVWFGAFAGAYGALLLLLRRYSPAFSPESAP